MLSILSSQSSSIGLLAQTSSLVYSWEGAKACEDDMWVALTAWILITDIQKCLKTSLWNMVFSQDTFHRVWGQSTCWLCKPSFGYGPFVVQNCLPKQHWMNSFTQIQHSPSYCLFPGRALKTGKCRLINGWLVGWLIDWWAKLEESAPLLHWHSLGSTLAEYQACTVIACLALTLCRWHFA